MGPARNRTGRPTREEAPLLARKIVDIATEMFIASGYSGTTMEKLARAAGVSKKTIYARYADKEALFRDVVRQMARPSIREGLAGDDTLTLEQGLRQRARLIMAATLEPRSMAFYRLIQREVAQFPELGKVIESQNIAELYDPLTEYFRSWKDNGELRDVEPEWAAKLFVYLVFGDLNSRLLMAAGPPSDHETEEYLDRVCGIFLRGIP